MLPSPDNPMGPSSGINQYKRYSGTICLCCINAQGLTHDVAMNHWTMGPIRKGFSVSNYIILFAPDYSKSKSQLGTCHNISYVVARAKVLPYQFTALHCAGSTNIFQYLNYHVINSFVTGAHITRAHEVIVLWRYAKRRVIPCTEHNMICMGGMCESVGIIWCLTHWGRVKMAAIYQETFSNAFSWTKMYKFR